MNDIEPQPIPVVLSGQALMSLRESGHNFPSAVGEVIDNSIEAKANHIQIVTEEGQVARKKVIKQVAIIDDGKGMEEETLHHYLQLGFSTRFMSNDTIGKFGVGAKLAGLSVAMRMDAWSRVEGTDRIRHVFFDLSDAVREEEVGNEIGIAPPDDEPLPAHLLAYFPEGSGTLVLWSKIDRVSDGHGRTTPDHVRNELNKELSRVFREFLSGGIRITVDGLDLRPHDPTFRHQGTWVDHVLAEHLRRTANAAFPGGQHHFAPQVFFDDEVSVEGTQHKVHVTITLAPPEVLRHKGSGGDGMAKQLRLPENEGAISFLRHEREISYTPVARLYPDGVKTPDRFIGFEVRFTPELDRLMGVRNVKRGAVPADELRTTLRDLAKRIIPGARAELARIWGQQDRERAEHAGEHAPIIKAVKKADHTMPKSRVKSVPTPAEKERAYGDMAKDAGKADSAEEKAAYAQEISQLPFVIETVDFPGDQMFELTHLGEQTLIRLNERHSFYREMYEPLRALADGSNGDGAGGKASSTAKRALEAITLLIVAYAKAETQHGTPDEQYAELRKHWGSFTQLYMNKIKDVL
ncbi:ATP-binding protein [Streptomyces sp. TRM66268-LWL]|uniref:ATP-binding protein n=1 Tax=Streptomyces polyasparticus TaxID=2767826 RepID=A0ABR7SSB0_9ACTN|nr:ATP-binding protein [Streptomyces polyasparticus]MBC9717842.1 ATP-binding protein [Streptomyces polyasparticus]